MTVLGSKRSESPPVKWGRVSAESLGLSLVSFLPETSGSEPRRGRRVGPDPTPTEVEKYPPRCLGVILPVSMSLPLPTLGEHVGRMVTCLIKGLYYESLFSGV